MPIVAIFSGSFCHGEEVAERLAGRLGYARLLDQEILEAAAARFGMPPDKLSRAMHGPPAFFNRITREREKGIAYLRAAWAREIGRDNLVYHGFLTHLTAKSLTHVLRVCLAARREYRVKQFLSSRGGGERDAERQILKDDEERLQWTQAAVGTGPWDESLYDALLPMHATTVDQAVETLAQYVQRPALASTEATRQAVADSLLAAEVQVALVTKGHDDTEVLSQVGQITILINKYAIRLAKLQEELVQIARTVPGVVNATARPGPRYREPGLVVDFDHVEVPSKVLLVDDEKEFVHTLSERLQARSMEPSIAYDGEQAMAMVASETPEVMVLDLKMPGLDGIEVLRRVKRDHPETEVIILTGHGSEVEEKMAAELGAFAYLKKPVDIELLTRTMQEAYRRHYQRKAARQQKE
jgi:two-component system response regulator CpxR